ncbi:hypothetical protein C8F04DRAFT_1249973 [Mycena alexandri]|uniref:MYND-type domain-containing protein n=1 Tax=Mycena alexandri TaxID=1745969 RepID=A0AAD6TFH9_9AGAR|nr:hypothetical protein C8F04DRAFT_1249973 [Mycena alexandri]
MPMLQFCAGTNDRCYECNNSGPADTKLRTCSRCRVARYCSPECQRKNWKLHKLSCNDHKAIIESDPDPTLEDNLKLFLKWLDHWKDAVHAWGILSADLANQAPGYLLNNSYLLEIEKRRSDKHPTRSKFIVARNGMRTEAQMREEIMRLPNSNYRAQILSDFEGVPRDPRMLRVTVRWDTFYSNSGDYPVNLFPDTASAFCNPLSAESRLISTALALTWRNKFPEHVRTGNATGYVEVVQKLVQDSKILVDTALGVD